LFQETIPILAEDIFAILGDEQSVEILGAAFTGFLSSNGIPNQTKKQYYVRLKRLVDIGLIEKQHRTYKLTSFGSIVYENHVKTMDKILPNYWQIKSFDILKNRNDFPVEQKEKIINEYIETTGLKGVINTTHLSSFSVVKRFDDLIVEILKYWIMLKRRSILPQVIMIRMFLARCLKKLVKVLQFTYLWQS
jgi:hypothetical protein